MDLNFSQLLFILETLAVTIWTFIFISGHLYLYIFMHITVIKEPLNNTDTVTFLNLHLFKISRYCSMFCILFLSECLFLYKVELIQKTILKMANKTKIYFKISLLELFIRKNFHSDPFVFYWY